VAGSDSRPASERAHERMNVRAELDDFERLINDLRVQYEQHFSGLLASPPDPLHKEVKRLRQRLMSAPFRNTETNFRFRALESRYQTYRTYWERVNKAREEGTYSRDLFRADLRERQVRAGRRAETVAGAADQSMQNLFNSYRAAVQETSGQDHRLEFAAFRETLLDRAAELRARTGAERVSFQVVVEDGKVVVRATAKG